MVTHYLLRIWCLQTLQVRSTLCIFSATLLTQQTTYAHTHSQIQTMAVLVCHRSINSNLPLGGKDSEGSQTYKTCLGWEQPSTVLQIKVRASNLLRQPLSLSLSLLQDRVLFLTLNLSVVRSRSPLINVILFYISHFSWAAGSFRSQARTGGWEVGYWWV